MAVKHLADPGFTRPGLHSTLLVHRCICPVWLSSNVLSWPQVELLVTESNIQFADMWKNVAALQQQVSASTSSLEEVTIETNVRMDQELQRVKEVSDVVRDASAEPGMVYPLS